MIRQRAYHIKIYDNIARPYFKLFEKLEIIIAKISKSSNKPAKSLSETSNLNFNTKRVLAFLKADRCAKLQNLRKSAEDWSRNLIQYYLDTLRAAPRSCS